MQLNPILALEVRARWRMNRSYLLLLGVALALSVLATFVYQSVTSQSDFRAGMTGSGFVNASGALQTFNGGASAVGRQLFVTLAHANILSWLLLGVAAASTSIARERERGLLESLQLSRMSARGQIAARFGAGVLLLCVLQLVLLPVYAVAILMGGISLPEVMGAIGIAAGAAALSTALGLWFSARSHRATGALFSSLIIVALLSGGVLYWIVDTLYWSSRAFGAINWDALWPMLLHPSGLFWALTDAAPKWSFSPLQMVGAVGTIWTLASLALLESAARNVNRTLPAPAWQTGSRWIEKLRQKQKSAPPASRSAQCARVARCWLICRSTVSCDFPIRSWRAKSRRVFACGAPVSGSVWCAACCFWAR